MADSDAKSFDLSLWRQALRKPDLDARAVSPGKQVLLEPALHIRGVLDARPSGAERGTAANIRLLDAGGLLISPERQPGNRMTGEPSRMKADRLAGPLPWSSAPPLSNPDGRVATARRSFTVHATTEPYFDGGRTSITNQKVVRSATCENCPNGQCFHVTGNLVIRYHVDVKTTMPHAPAGYSPCQTAKIREFINTTLREHENEHARRLSTYNGRQTIPLDVTGCGHREIEAQIQALHNADDQARRKAARDLSKAIDPFNKFVDLSVCEDG